MKGILRLIGWGIGAAIIFALLSSIGHMRLGKAMEGCTGAGTSATRRLTALEQAKALMACLDQHSGLEKVLLNDTRKILASLPNTPCQYVGVWESTRAGGAVYEITLKEDGSFKARPKRNTPPGGYASGSWGISGHRMVWVYDEGWTWPPDVNTIQEETAQSFTLVEMNGSRTRFIAQDEPLLEACFTQQAELRKD